MALMAAQKRVTDKLAVDWRARIRLDPWAMIDLDAWCEANCRSRFARDGATFLFESPRDCEIFASIWA